MIRVAPEPLPTLLAGSVAALLADLGGSEFAAEALRRVVRDLGAEDARERLQGAPADVLALLGEPA